MIEEGDRVRHKSSKNHGTVVEVRDEGLYRVDYDHRDRVLLQSNIEKFPDDCPTCNSDKIYHDKREEWICPFCDL